MEKQKIADFRASVANLSLDELKKMRGDIQDGISKMILDSDLMIKAAIVETLIKEKENG